MLGQMNYQVIAPRAQAAQERSFLAKLRPRAQLAPLAPDAVQLGERRMAFEHRRGVVVDQRIDLEPRRVRPQNA